MPINFVAKAAIAAVMVGAQVALGAMRKTEGPRLDDLNTTTADYGNPLEDFWGRRLLAGRPIIWAEKLREKKKKSKGKSGKYAEFKYFGTWAVAIAGHPIDAVAAIYLDKRKVYQATGAGPITSLIISALVPEADDAVFIPLDSVKIYLGTQTLPDPRMEAWFDDKFGPNSCSALNGISYIVFKDIPLEKFANRIPQVDIDAISVKASNYPVETKPQVVTTGGTSGNQYSPDFTTLYAIQGGLMDVWDVPTRTLIATGVATNVGDFVVLPNGEAAGFDAFFGQNIISVNPGGGETLLVPNADIPVIMQRLYSLPGYLGLTSAGATTDAYLLQISSAVGAASIVGGIQSIPVGFDVDGYFVDPTTGDLWAVGDSGSDIGLTNLTTSTGYLIASTTTGDCFGMVNATGQIVVYQNASLFLIDPATGSILDTGTVVSSSFNPESVMKTVVPGAASIWFGFAEYSTADLTQIRFLSAASWPGGGFAILPGGVIYDPINHALMVTPFFDSATRWWFYLDRVASNGVLLQSIVEEDALRANCIIDGSDLDQVVFGYSVAPGPVKDRLAPLFDIHDSILRLHDFTIQGLKRGTASVGTIYTRDFVREADADRYTIETAQDTDLPLRIEVKFADKDHDQQVNVVMATRQTDAVDTVRIQPIDLTTYADSADGMQQKGDRFLRVQWNMRSRVTLEITAQHLAAEVGDVYDLELDGTLWTAELQKLTLLANSPSMKVEARRTFPSLNTLGSNNGPGIGGYDDEVIFVPGPAKGFVFDIPLVTDSDNATNPFLYYAIGGYGVGSFPGASLSEAAEITEDYSEVESVTSTQDAAWGFATDALGSANPNLWDRGNSMNVRVYGDTLTTVTEAAIDADPDVNMAALRNPATGLVELLNFATATLEVDGTYTLSGFKRGRRGTEGAVGSHAIGDEFVLVSDLHKHGMGLSDVGDDWFYKAQTFGRDPDSAPAVPVDFAGATLKPYAPAQLEWTTDGTDLFGEITRRTRVGGSWTGGSAIPLSELSEAYEVDILDGSGNVIDTITVTATNTFTITAAELATYSATVAVPPDINVYQMSDAVGRGFALAA